MQISHRRVLSIAIPIVLSNVTVPLLGLVDTGVIGQLGRPEPIGAVGIGAVVLTSIYWVFGFLRMGTSGLVAQSHGAGDAPEAGAHLLRALTIACVIGLALILLQIPLVWAVFQLAPASGEVETLAREYLAIRIWGAPAAIGLYAITGWLIAIERTRAVLALQLLQNGLHVGLDFWFVLGLGLGVPGVAIATLLDEWSGLLLGLWLARHALQAAVIAARNLTVLFARDRLDRLLRVNGDIMMRSMLLAISIPSFMFLGAAHGDVTLASNQVLIQFLAVTAFALDGFAFAAESLVGQAVGARRPADLRRASVVTSQWAVGGAVILGLAYWLGGGAIIDLLTTSPEVRQEARIYLIWLAFLPIVSVAGWMYDGIFIGATLTREMLRAMVQAIFVYFVALMLLPPVMGAHGLWASLLILNAARGVAMARLYPRAEAVAQPSV